MIPFLIAFIEPDRDFLLTHPPEPSYQICLEMEYDIYQGAEFGIITKDQADALLLRCLVNYSTGPNAPHVTDI